MPRRDTTSVRISKATLQRLHALAASVNLSLAELVDVLSHTNLTALIQEETRKAEVLKLILQSSAKGAREAKARKGAGNA